MTKILVLEKPEEKLRRERERLLGELSVYGERLAVIQETVDEIEEMIEYYDVAIENQGTDHAKKNTKTLKEAFADMGKAFGGSNFDEWFRNKEDSENIYLLKALYGRGFNYLARDKDGELWAYDVQPIKLTKRWMWLTGGWGEKVGTDNFPEVKWSDEEPTKISKLLATYENGGENRKWEAE